MTYIAPTEDVAFCLTECTSALALARAGAFAGFDGDLAAAILEEAGKFASNVLLPLDAVLDREGCRIENGAVLTAKGHREAYRAFVEAGWMGLTLPAKWGGQELPLSLGAACLEFWHSGSMAFAMGTLLTMGAAETIEAHGTEALRQTYLPKLVSGEWTATMALTEPQAGSDLSGIRTRAEPASDGSYRLFGTKIFISYGDHDLTDNIVHLVLARLPDAPAGSAGISLFLVPKMLPDGQGGIGAVNEVACSGLEKKLGQHGSPTCPMVFGERQGATGWLVGVPNKGLAAMFTMMNRARLAVAMQGIAVAERAFQSSLSFARERRQGRDPLGRSPGPAPILAHPDIQRMLMTIRAQTSAARLIALATADALDRARHASSVEARAAARSEADLLTPVAKAFCTDLGVEAASLAIQIHGGAGYVEETGVSQLLRDARIATIYEGTNGIQAIDLVARKLPAGDGTGVRELIARFVATAAETAASPDREIATSGEILKEACHALARATEHLLDVARQKPLDALAGAASYLRLFALVAGGTSLARACNAPSSKDAVRRQLMLSFRFFAERILPEAGCLARVATARQDLFADIRELLGVPEGGGPPSVVTSPQARQGATA
ncbi:acyl-CoA dehydrogenase [Mesorhizobium australicum]|uniref:3-methylmercaptopropionyl-CoA dehydrogenase n=1 Tax=Mesorhizobium australicum TaxID=536018 RepID=A0A1X7MT59_9HYPH|nr:acyl-CoA dehydrogenase [Mesorhizobium australicum]SMH27814.1 hypothetical protein SAMN02982922_0638 [Mesorhizobium australicum]